jgi:uncharacterized NAD(P)/FAD-binding protein YdhS
MDFKLYTTALKAYTADNGDMYVSGTTSSTIRDLQGDEMTTDALKSMADTAKKNMTIWLNHNYNVPEDLFGSVTDARIVKRVDEASGEQVYDLDIDIDSQIAALQKLASDLASEAQKAGTSADQAQSALEQINAILGGVGQSPAEVTSEGRLLERWNTLAFGRKLL